MNKRGGLLLPGETGWSDDLHTNLYWNRLRAAANLPIKTGATVHIDGFFIKDNRMSPAMVIFKNCSFEWKTGPLTCDNIRVEEVLPFPSAYEAYLTVRKMALSYADQHKMEIIALARDPGLGEPMPDVMFVPKKELKQR